LRLVPSEKQHQDRGNQKQDHKEHQGVHEGKPQLRDRNEQYTDYGNCQTDIEQDFHRIFPSPSGLWTKEVVAISFPAFPPEDVLCIKYTIADRDIQAGFAVAQGRRRLQREIIQAALMLSVTINRGDWRSV